MKNYYSSSEHGENMKKVLFRLALFSILAFALGSCGLFFGRGWGCSGPYYYKNDNAAIPNDYNHQRYKYNESELAIDDVLRQAVLNI